VNRYAPRSGTRSVTFMRTSTMNYGDRFPYRQLLTIDYFIFPQSCNKDFDSLDTELCFGVLQQKSLFIPAETGNSRQCNTPSPRKKIFFSNSSSATLLSERQAHQFIPFLQGQLGNHQLSYSLNIEQYSDPQMSQHALLLEGNINPSLTVQQKPFSSNPTNMLMISRDTLLHSKRQQSQRHCPGPRMLRASSSQSPSLPRSSTVPHRTSPAEGNNARAPGRHAAPLGRSAKAQAPSATRTKCRLSQGTST
jgi:hypothetical protein